MTTNAIRMRATEFIASGYSVDDVDDVRVYGSVWNGCGLSKVDVDVADAWCMVVSGMIVA